MGVLTTIGTAGHIDHGKTTLVKALTGIDTDRLPEEKRRGISIDLGFAHFTTPGGRELGIVDVPGHEKFIRNMVAGVWGIRAYLLVVAADEGIMPQTREHRDILELLGVTRGIVALTKTDLVDDEMRALVRADVEAWMAGTPFQGAAIVETAASRPESIQAVGAELDRLLDTLPDPATGGLFRLPVDRVFSLKGHGTIVTGTVASGTLKPGETIEILPAGTSSRVRSLQAFDRPVEEVHAGQRAALNLPDVDGSQVARGDLLAVPGYFRPSHVIDCRLHLLRNLPKGASPLESGTRVRLYIGTREVMGRVHLLEGTELAEGKSAFVQLRLESPVAAARRDRYLLRLYSPTVTIGGGEVLEPCAGKHKKGAHAVGQLQAVEKASNEELVMLAIRFGSTPFQTVRRAAVGLQLPEPEIQRALELGMGALARAGEHYYHKERIDRETASLVKAVEAFHEQHSTAPGIDKQTLAHQTFGHLAPDQFELLLALAAARGDVKIDQHLVRRPSWKPSAGAKLEGAVKKVEAELEHAPELFLALRSLEANLRLMRHEFADLVKFLVVSKRAVKVGPDMIVSKANFDTLLEKAMGVLRKKGVASTPELKDALGLSRKYLIPFLEHLDQTGVTARSGNDRVLRAKG